MRKVVFGLLFCFLMLGCEIASNVPTPTAPTAPPVPPTPTSAPDSGWQTLHTGFERRQIRLYSPQGEQVDSLHLLRIDPNLYALGLAYSPRMPKSLDQWQDETGALLVVNGGFFTENFEATGLIVVDGVSSGQSYAGFGGMVTMQDGYANVRGLVQYPFDSAETPQNAIQAFPMLIEPGSRYSDGGGQPARRTVIAQDQAGRLLFILSSRSHFTLAGMAEWLANSDLALVNALNLDGGTSTGLRIQDSAENVPSFALLPTVLTVDPR